MQLIKVMHQLDRTTVTQHADDDVILPYDLRQKARQRVKLRSGREAGLYLPRGTTLRNGDLLCSEDGLHLKVVAADEQVSIAHVGDNLLLAKIAYHLGNRHVAVQIMADRLIYLHDHVLDEMVRGLGASVTVHHQPFEPQEGAYHGGGHHHH
jgi:urease accessory protein